MGAYADYDSVAAWYVENWYRDARRRKRIRATWRIARQSGVEIEGKRLLDIGSANSFFSTVLNGQQPSIYLASDVSHEMLKRNKMSGRICCDGCRLPFKDASFDIIVAFNSLGYMPDPTSAISEMRRVAIPGANLMLLVANLEHRYLTALKSGNAEILGELVRTRRKYQPHFNAFERSWGSWEIERMLEEAGWHSRVIEGIQWDGPRRDEDLLARGPEEVAMSNSGRFPLVGKVSSSYLVVIASTAE